MIRQRPFAYAGGGGSTSSQNVTGPSFVSATCISAPNSPTAHGTPLTLMCSTNRANIAAPISGGAAVEKLGRSPLLVFAASVNCGTSKHAAADIADGEVHSRRVVGKNPIAEQAFREPVRLGFAIAPHDADEHEQATTDLGDDRPGNGHPRLSDAL